VAFSVERARSEEVDLEALNVAMKFAKALRQTLHPAWSQEYVPYKSLKRLLKPLKISHVAQSTMVEAEFLALVVGSVQSADTFFSAKKGELVALLQRLCMRTSTDGTSALHEAVLEHSCPMHERRTILCTFQQAYLEVHRLREFSQLNMLAVHKIIKKHDKVSPIKLRLFVEPFLRQRDFHSTDRLDSILADAEAILADVIKCARSAARPVFLPTELEVLARIVPPRPATAAAAAHPCVATQADSSGDSADDYSRRPAPAVRPGCAALGGFSCIGGLSISDGSPTRSGGNSPAVTAASAAVAPPPSLPMHPAAASGGCAPLCSSATAASLGAAANGAAASGDGTASASGGGVGARGGGDGLMLVQGECLVPSQMDTDVAESSGFSCEAKRVPACVECRRAKAACEGNPCQRCVRLGKECVREERKRRRRNFAATAAPEPAPEKGTLPLAAPVHAGPGAVQPVPAVVQPDAAASAASTLASLHMHL